MKKILILHTGGTFGMELQQDFAKIQNSTNLLENLLNFVPELSKLAAIEMKAICNIDSSNSTPELWLTIAKTIYHAWQDFDGFVVIHGTDTMAWSATAIAYLLSNINKSVVFTGSQRPLTALRSDARTNIIDAVELATYGIAEVMLCFDAKVHRATRVTKYSNENLYAFKSYNAPLLARFGVNFKLNSKLTKTLLNKNNSTPILHTKINSNIISLLCVPGISLAQEFIDAILNTSRAIIIQAFGSGNLPTINTGWLQLCERAFIAQIPVVMSTQCAAGAVSLNLYENAKAYAKLGVISALDMTFEAASIKLMLMLGRNIKFTDRYEFFTTPLACECTAFQAN